MCNIYIGITQSIRSDRGVLISAAKWAWLQFPKGSRPVNLSLLGQAGSASNPEIIMMCTHIQKKIVFIHIFLYLQTIY